MSRIDTGLCDSMTNSGAGILEMIFEPDGESGNIELGELAPGKSIGLCVEVYRIGNPDFDRIRNQSLPVGSSAE